MRWCLKNPYQGLIEETENKITYKKEYLEPLINKELLFFSPSNNSTYIANETIETNNSIDNINKYQIVIGLNIITIEQYRYRKYVNGIATDPPEYSNNGVIYDGKVTEKTEVLKDSEYELIITE